MKKCKMGRPFGAVFFAIALGSLSAAATTVGADASWMAVGGEVSGVYTNVAHWWNGILPGLHDDVLRHACFNSRGSYAIAWPEGDYADPSGIKLYTAEGDETVLDGRQTRLTITGAAWTANPFRFFYSSATAGSGRYLGVGYTGGDRTVAAADNFLIRIRAKDGGLDFNVEEGAYNFKDPRGETAGPIGLTLFNSGEYGSQIQADALTVRLEKGVSLASGALDLWGTATPLNRLVCNGARIDVTGDFQAQCYGNPTDVRRQEIYWTNGTAVAVSGGVNVQAKAGSQMASAYLRMEDSSLDVQSGVLFRYGEDIAADFLRSAVTNKCANSLWTQFGDSAADGCYRFSLVDSSLASARHIRFDGATSGSRAEPTTVFVATNSAVVQLSMNDAYGLRFEGDVSASFVDCTIKMASLRMSTGATPGHAPKAVFDGGTFTCTDAPQVGILASAEATFRDGEQTIPCNFFLGGDITASSASVSDNAPTGTLTVAGTDEFDQTGGSSFLVGSRNGCFGVFNVQDSATATVKQLNVGRYGVGFVTVSGGTLKTGYDAYVAAQASTAADESVLTQTGGEIEFTVAGQGLTVAQAAGRKGGVRLLGGTMKTGYLRGGAGVSTLTADGGRLVVTKASDDFLSGFSTATLGDGGLAIASDADIGLGQDFTDDGTGLMTLEGAGVKTFTGTVSAPSRLVVSSGAAVFGESAAKPGSLVVTNYARVALAGDVTLTDCVLGDDVSCGVLEISPTTRITVTGDLDIRHLQLVLNGSFPSGSGCDLFVCPNGVSQASADAFAAAFAKSGLAAGTACDLVRIPGAGGAVTLRLNVVPATPLLIRVDEGVSNVTDDVIYNASRTLTAQVAEGATLNMSGRLGYGRLEKTGRGRLFLDNVDNLFYNGVVLDGGKVSLSDPLAFGKDDVMVAERGTLKDGTLEVTGPAEGARFEFAPAIAPETATDAVIVKCDVETAMPLPAMTGGAFIKRGVAPLTFESDGERTLALDPNGTMTGGSLDETPFDFDEDGNVPDDGRRYAGFNVAEGELVLKGVGAGATNVLPASVRIGLAARTVGAVPTLTVDNLALRTRRDGITFVLNGNVGKDSQTELSTVRLCLTNGAALLTSSLSLNSASSHAGIRSEVVVDGSVLQSSGNLGTSDGWPERESMKTRSFFEVRNGGGIYCPTVLMKKPTAFVFCDATLGGVDFANRALTTVWPYGGADNVTSLWTFVRSEFRCGAVERPYGANADGLQTFVFEDSEWWLGDRDAGVGATNVNMAIEVRGRGLRLAPPAGRTWTVNRPVTGEGGVVMDGAGTLVFGTAQYRFMPLDDPRTARFEGALEVNDGCVDFRGVSLTNAVLAGAGGSLSNVELVRATTANTNLLYSGVSFVGRYAVDLGRTASDPVVAGKPLPVGRYEGVKPDVSRWRLKNTGLSGASAEFAAEDGLILATPRVNGIVIIVR